MEIPDTKKQEGIKTKAELDAEIATLQEEHDVIVDTIVKLKTSSDEVFKEYGIAKEHLESFKESVGRIEEKIENPTLSEKLLRKFAPLFGQEGDPKSRESYMSRWPNREETEEYQKERYELRDSVGYIAARKDFIRKLIGEDLSFTGGKMESEEKSNREKAFEKIAVKIKELEQKLTEIQDSIKTKREEAYEAWKKENPEEHNRLEIEKKNKEESESKIALFSEFVKTNPKHEEVWEIVVASLKYKGSEYREFVIDWALKNLSWNYGWILPAVLKTQDQKFVDQVVSLVTENINKCGYYGGMNSRDFKNFLFVGSEKVNEKFDDLRKLCIEKFEKQFGLQFPLVALEGKKPREIYEFVVTHSSELGKFNFGELNYALDVIFRANEGDGKYKFISKLIEEEGIDILSDDVKLSVYGREWSPIYHTPSDFLTISLFKFQYSDDKKFTKKALEIIAEKMMQSYVLPNVDKMIENLEDWSEISKSISEASKGIIPTYENDPKLLADELMLLVNKKIVEWKSRYDQKVQERKKLKDDLLK